MLALTAPEAGFLLTFVCLALSPLLIWACYDAEQPRRPFWFHTRNITRRRR